MSLKFCNECVHYTMGNDATPMCGHPSNMLSHEDLVCGRRLPIFSCRHLRYSNETPCGFEGKLWEFRKAFYNSQTPLTKQKFSINDI